MRGCDKLAGYEAKQAGAKQIAGWVTATGQVTCGICILFRVERPSEVR